ncbi:MULTISPECIES: SDR family NAD(P)-dependent oxidoreductase [Variovorax]|jgi:NAD(P)-dependent dehydrogenase (short-subunit alcohol dehydrogenase family)|uniref:NAD(P)-dependent dehydrogenase (Short-subunit alcohol dehydrogenase family) n=2 Tax=Variovorax paradoxus TaxID=34073 RepID=A0AAW8EBY3_VARPD|nr:SDR family oxidoreductase [Variovorax paradoxus]MBW8717047.1 SDR family oxidoreductase [Variovorax paradoxus]MDP9970385.1 NAD(P)-dependent dehydrogenase (short-subunit alcohol dehydrogenase family) [Variovorax paradoxus]
MQDNTSPTVVITGASSGIGLGLAQAYLERGFNVVANARTEERLAAAAKQLGNPARLLGVAGDIGRRDTAQQLVERAVERFGQVDVLINNAGIFNAKPFVEYTEDDLEQMVATNLKGFVYASQAAAKHMVARRQGHIVNITASIALQPNQQVPAALPVLIKGGINAATRALALELAPHNVKVNAVAPGIVDTPLYTPEQHGFLNGLAPAGRIATVREIADAVLYLTSADFTTGVVLPVDGGMSSGKW